MITSPDNQHIKELRQLARRAGRERTGRFVGEGEDLIEAAQAAGWEAVVRLCRPGAQRAAAGWLEVDPDLLRSVSALGSGSREVAIYEQRWSEPVGGLCVYLDGVRDPGNVGTVVRSALAFGATSLVLGPGCADPYGPKAVRAAMGATFAVPLSRAKELDGLPGEVIGLDAAGDETLVGPVGRPTTLVVGGERNGLTPEARRVCTRICRIGMAAGESLNAAMAATIGLYEMTRVAPS